MTRQTDPAVPRPQQGRLVASLGFAVLGLGGAAFYAVQALSRDDCTTVTTRMSDGSQVTTKTCS